jgi:TatD DNase family protein
MTEDRERIPTFPGGDGKPVVLPDLGSPTADAHAHLDMLEDPIGALARAAEAGVTLVASVVDLTEDPELTFEGLDPWLAAAGELVADPRVSPLPQVPLVCGVHPHNAAAYGPDVHERLRALAGADRRVAALGELGLDFHYDHSPRDAQRAMFRSQLELAHELGLPVIVHLRESHDEGAAILEEVGVPRAGCIIHCFTEGPGLAERFLALDDAVMVSFAGPVTFPKAEQIREAARVVPPDRLLVETDCPFLAPAPYRGRANEPAFVTLNAAMVAGATGLEPAEVAAAALANARRLFSRAVA